VVHPPFFYALNSQQELLTFYRTLADATDLPLILYNIPSLTKQPIAVETVRELLKHPNIIAIKDSSVDYVNLIELIKLKKEFPSFRVFVGKTHMFTPCLLAGGDGGVDGISNLIPERCVHLVELIKSGKIIEAYRLQDEINEIWNVYHVRSFVAGIKMAMHLAGLCGTTVSSPLLTLSDAEKEHVHSIMAKHNLIRI
jgi:4-hydroxy-tetrahydrodipicolinate synthase